MAAIGSSSSPISSPGSEKMTHGISSEIVTWSGVGALAAFSASAAVMDGADGIEVENRNSQASGVWLRATIVPVAGTTLKGTKVIYIAPEQTINATFEDDSAVAGMSVIGSVDILPVRKTDAVSPSLSGGVSTFAAVISAATTPTITARYTLFEA